MTHKLMKTTNRFFLPMALLFAATVVAQPPTFTAHTQVPPYTAIFQYGSNQGFYSGYNNNKPNDKLIADLLVKAGRHTTRLALYDQFLDVYGTAIRVPEFNYYVDTAKFKEITLFLSGPTDAHRATDSVTCTNVNTGKKERFRNQMFRGLDLPIWDDSTNGKTPINDANYYAAYVYKVVKTYGKYVTFYEVLEQPDYAANENVMKVSGEPGNWWDENPTACDLTSLRAPFPSYVRALRITYEIVKRFDPTAFVATGGLGFPNFMDAILRNTDNPNGGAVSDKYPLTGGAYFDVVNFQAYPQYDLKIYDPSTGKFIQTRHSDAAAQKVIKSYQRFQDVLARRGYDGVTFPAKHTILSEVNIPRKYYPDKEYIGSPEAQRNFIIKTFVLAQKEGIKQMYTYTAGDTKDSAVSTSANDGKDLMGMYYNLNKVDPESVEMTEAGLGSASLSTFLYGYQYNAALTDSLKLPSTVDGGVFSNNKGTRIVLWAKTTTDRVETNSLIYSFPKELKVTSMEIRKWDYTKTGTVTKTTGKSVALTGTPVMLIVESVLGLEETDSGLSSLSIYPNPAHSSQPITIAGIANGLEYLEIVDMQGKPMLRIAGSELKAAQNQVATAELQHGIYLVKMHRGDSVITRKLVVE